MKIKKQILKEFLSKILLGGTEIIDEVILNFSEKGLEVVAMSQSNITRVQGLLKPAAFSGYEAINKIGLNELQTIIRLIDTFQDEINLSVQGNLLTLNEQSRKVEVELLDLDNLEEVTPLKELSFDETFVVNANKLNKFVNDVNINSDVSILFKTTEKKLSLSNEGKYKFTQIFDDETIKGGASSKFSAESFTHIIKPLCGDIDISIGTNFPMEIKETTNNSNIRIVTAPMVDEE